MSQFGTEVEGLATFRATLGRAADELDNLEAAGAKAGKAIADRAASGAPVDTGALARSISATATGTEITVVASVPYARFVEYGTVNVAANPYLRPALDAATGEVVTAYAEQIQNLLESVKGA